MVVALCFTKIWRVTPDGCTPVIRINVLDWLQARALEKTAIRELRAGKIQDGIISYNRAATIFEKYGLDQYLISLLTPRQAQLTPPLQNSASSTACGFSTPTS